MILKLMGPGQPPVVASLKWIIRGQSSVFTARTATTAPATSLFVSWSTCSAWSALSLFSTENFMVYLQNYTRRYLQYIMNSLKSIYDVFVMCVALRARTRSSRGLVRPASTRSTSSLVCGRTTDSTHTHRSSCAHRRPTGWRGSSASARSERRSGINIVAPETTRPPLLLILLRSRSRSRRTRCSRTAWPATPRQRERNTRPEGNSKTVLY